MTQHTGGGSGLANFDQIRIGLASPDEIRRWSRGEVKKPETINYRTFKPEPDGLFCEKIFGPTRDWECHCGKYRKIKFKGVVCDRCGVEVMRAKVRRERMGHIELVAPVAHIWYLKNVPSPMSLLLDLSPRPLEKVLYFASYIVTYVNSDLMVKYGEQIRNAVERRKHELDLALQDHITSIQEQFVTDMDEMLELAVNERNKMESQRDERINYERKQIEDRKNDMDNALRLLMGQNLDVAPGITLKQLLTEPEHRSLSSLAEEIDNIFILLREDDHSEYIDEINDDTKIDGQSSGVRILVRDNDTDTAKTLIISQTGADAIKALLRQIKMEDESRALRQKVKEITGPRRLRAIKQLTIVDHFMKSKNRPEWMILDVVPVIPPELRPMVQLDGGRFATSDLNDLYRRIINRNNRLKKIKDLRAPESIINHEKRLLQEAVDALIDNSRRSRPVTGSNNRPLKSLSDMLKGKDGRFRKNLLGKRVDYSGRSVIVVGPHLKLNQCGLPKEMALELFKPFVMKRLVQKGLTGNVKTAKKMVDRMRPEVWDALEEVIADHPVMLNRAPTLHRLGIQAFEPVLVDGKAIQLHPLVCTAFNADFDGDQMAVHVPLSTSAQAEARILMMSTENLFSPAHGKPTMTPTRDMVLGIYYITMKGLKNGLGTGKTFPSAQEAMLAYETGMISLHAEILVRINGALTHTTVGRLIFNTILPPKLQYLDRVVDSGEMANIIRMCYDAYGQGRTVKLLDDLKEIGFKYSTISGISIAMTDMDVPHADRESIIGDTEARVNLTNERFEEGNISEGERAQTVCDLWMKAADDVANSLLKNLDPFNPLLMMSNSGARGSKRQLAQLAGMRGLMTDPFGRFIEDLPIKSNFHEGLNVLEYFVSTHGARKGLADTALRTADAGYLTRRMVDVAQDVIVRGHDCGTVNGIEVGAIRDRHEEIEPLDRRIEGRIANEDIYDPFTGKLILRRNQEISNRSLPACTTSKCDGELKRAWQCPNCDSITTEDEYKEMVSSLTYGESKEDELERSLEESINLDDTPKEAISAEQAELEAEAAAEKEDLALRMEASIPNELCPHCQTQVVEIAVCADCNTHFRRADLESPLATIRRIVRDVEMFNESERDARNDKYLIERPAVDPFSGKIIVPLGKKATEPQKQQLAEIRRKLRSMGGLATAKVPIRSLLTCDLRQGICAMCYGRDLATGRLVEAGEAVGIIAAQSIGEPGTQLTMRTFHTGGVAGQYLTGVANVKDQRVKTLQQLHDDINRGRVNLGVEMTEREKVKQIQKMVKVMEQQVSGLLRVVELFEARKPKGQAIITEYDGLIAKIDASGGGRTVHVHVEFTTNNEDVIGRLLATDVKDPLDDKVLYDAGKEVTPPVLAKLRQAGVDKVYSIEKYMVPHRGNLRVDEGDIVKAGNPLTEGPLEPQELLKKRGPRDVQEYLVQEIQRVYRSQGVDINDKHVETIVRQMLRKRKISEPGDADFLPGDVVDRFKFEEENIRVREAGGVEAQADWQLLGITEASLATDSFLSAASFQKTTRVLTDAAIEGKIDHLVGLKENVIIGRLIPAGTGMDRYKALRLLSPGGEVVRHEEDDSFGDNDLMERLLEDTDHDQDIMAVEGEDMAQLIGNMTGIADDEEDTLSGFNIEEYNLDDNNDMFSSGDDTAI